VAIITSARHHGFMTMVTHQPRVAWDAARAFVIMAETPYPVMLSYGDFADQVYRRLGPAMYEALENTHGRLLANLQRTGGDRTAVDIERGAWRVRMEELLRSRPDLTDVVLELTSMVLRY
jgi:hypothetical protein